MQAAHIVTDFCDTTPIEIRGSITFTKIPFLGSNPISAFANPLLIAMGEVSWGKSGRNPCRIDLHCYSDYQLLQEITRRK